MQRCALYDLVKVKDFANLNVQCACCNLLDEFLKRHPHKIFGLTCVGGQTDRSRDRLHGREVLERPLIANYARHANNSTLLGTAQRVLQRCRAHQLENLVDAPGTHLFDLFGN